MRYPIFLYLLLLLPPLLGLVQAQDISEEEAAETSPIDNLTLEQCNKKVSSYTISKSKYQTIA